MWRASVLLLVLGSAGLWVPARGDEDVVTLGTEDVAVTGGFEDDIATTGAPESASSTGQASTRAERTTYIYSEDQPTPGSSVQGETQRTTPQNVPSVDGLATVTLVGIVVGVLLAIGFLAGIITVVVRKMSGGYAP